MVELHSALLCEEQMEGQPVFRGCEGKLNYMNAQNQEDAEQRPADHRAIDILDPNNQIGSKLRSLYAAAQDEAIPDRFLDLLEKLDHAEKLASDKISK